MKRTFLVALIVVMGGFAAQSPQGARLPAGAGSLGCNATSGDTADASTCLTACPTPVAAYCETASCPTAIPCSGATVYGGCGFTLVFTRGQEQVWDTNNNLVALYSLGEGTSCCVAGPPTFEAPSLQGCTITGCDAGGD